MSATRPTRPSPKSQTNSQLVETLVEIAKTADPPTKRRALALLQTERWHRQARTEATHPCGCGHSHSQIAPGGKWRAWYLQGGRGAGKTHAGAETLAGWIRDYCLTAGSLGDWAVIAPTIADARDTCMEGPSGLLRALKGVVPADAWNRSQNQLFLPNGSRVYCGTADDGAKRIQGKNLRGVWADEVGLWERWEQAWHYSIAHALRLEPGRIVATGTPKMGHPLVAQLIKNPTVPVHHMRMIDNEANLSADAIADLLAEYPEGSTVRRQELEGYFIEALEGSLLSRHHWRFFAAGWEVKDAVGRLDKTSAANVERRFGKFSQVVCSWDTTWKAKATSDFVAGQCWGIHGAERVLLAAFHQRASLEETIAAMLAMRGWADERYPQAKQSILIENATWGSEAAEATRKRVDGVTLIRAKGDKGARAFTASSALESHQCHLPGEQDEDPNGRGYTEATPAHVQAFVEEAAEFDPATMRHRHDDQVDAWSQMVNWTRRHASGRASMGRPRGQMPRPGSLQVKPVYGS